MQIDTENRYLSIGTLLCISNVIIDFLLVMQNEILTINAFPILVSILAGMLFENKHCLTKADFPQPNTNYKPLLDLMIVSNYFSLK